MTSKSRVYIAGVGYSPLPTGGSSSKKAVASLISAATKALLDAGVTFDDVSRGVRSGKSKDSSHGSEAFKAFDERGISVDEVEDGSEFESSFRLVKDRGEKCVLMIAVEKSRAIAFVLVSDNFLGKRPYLSDSAARVSESDASGSKSSGQTGEGLYDVCQMVWNLRGWSQSQKKSEKKTRLQYKGKSNKIFELTRADAKDTPEWKQVEHRQDGKHRLGYNPASETKDIAQEDFEAVRAILKDGKKADSSPRFDRKGGDRAALAKL